MRRASDASIWSSRKPVTTTTSSTPHAASVSSCRSSKDRPAKSIRHFGLVAVSGPSRDPWPAEVVAAFRDGGVERPEPRSLAGGEDDGLHTRPLARQLRQVFGSAI